MCLYLLTNFLLLSSNPASPFFPLDLFGEDGMGGDVVPLAPGGFPTVVDVIAAGPSFGSEACWV